MPNRRRRKLSTAMSAVAALAVASPVAVAALSDASSTNAAPQHREFTQAALVTDLPNELLGALSQGLSQFGVNLPSGIHYLRARQQWVARQRADTSRGGGIFLHVSDGGPTAGCVSMGIRPLRRLVRWLDPARSPMVAMGPRRFVKRL